MYIKVTSEMELAGCEHQQDDGSRTQQRMLFDGAVSCFVAGAQRYQAASEEHTFIPELFSTGLHGWEN